MELRSHIKDLLTRIGLTEKEAKLFLAVYQNPKRSIAELQKICGFSRTSTYRAYENLRNLNLITSSAAGWRKNVEAVSLHTLAEKMAREQRKFKKVELELKRLNNLMNLTRQSELPEPVEVLSDQNQVIEKCYKILQMPWERMLCYGSAERLIDVIGKKPEHDFVDMRVRKGKACDAILTELGDYTREFLPNNGRDLRNPKVMLDPENQNYVTYVYGDEAAIWHKDPEFGNRALIIKEPLLVNNLKQNFQRIWANA